MECTRWVPTPASEADHIGVSRQSGRSQITQPHCIVLRSGSHGRRQMEST